MPALQWPRLQPVLHCNKACTQGETLLLERCASTLRAHSRAPHWQCSLCCRIYQEAPDKGGPCCLICGVPIGQPQVQGSVQQVPALTV